MTRFEEIGVQRQLNSFSKGEAIRNYEHSCNICCTRGYRIECDRCSIDYVHKQTMARLNKYYYKPIMKSALV